MTRDYQKLPAVIMTCTIGTDRRQVRILTAPMRAAMAESPTSSPALTELALADLADSIRRWGGELGFQQIGIAGIDIREDEERLMRWLDQGRHGAMDYMERHGRRRARPQEL